MPGETIYEEAAYKRKPWNFHIGLLGRVENESVRRPLYGYRFSDIRQWDLTEEVPLDICVNQSNN